VALNVVNCLRYAHAIERAALQNRTHPMWSPDFKYAVTEEEWAKVFSLPVKEPNERDYPQPP
jgi:hypothetical protein